MALGTYTTQELVESVIGQTFSGTTTPTDTQINTFIDWASDEVESLTEQFYGVGTTTDELVDWTRFNAIQNTNTGYRDAFTNENIDRNDRLNLTDFNAFKVENKPIIEVTSLEKNINTYPTSPSWEVIGTSDYIISKPEGKITLVTNAIPDFGLRRFKISYTYGTSTAPKQVERLATLLVARQILSNKVANSNYGSVDSISIEGISINKTTGQGISYLARLDQEINNLKEQLGSLKTEII